MAAAIAPDEARIERLKQACLRRRAEGWIALGSTHFLDGCLDNLDRSPLVREALALERKFTRQAVEVYPDELITGRPGAECFDYHGLVGNYIRRRPQGDAALGAKLERARGLTTQLRVRESMSLAVREADEAGLSLSLQIAGHLVPDFEWLLAVGVEGIEAAITARERTGDGLAPDFAEAMRATARALSGFAASHARRASGAASDESDTQRRAELLSLAESCAWISRHPPRSFHEALQLVWLAHLMNTADSFGRFDQYLWPFYERDVQSGALTRARALHLIECLWLKVIEAGGIQNLTLGGVTTDGVDATNELTYLCLQASRELRQPQPNLSLRLSPDAPPELLEAALATISLGLGVPALYNDSVFVPALRQLGVSEEDANGYCLAGCSQVAIPGKSDFLCDDGVLNVAKCLELTLNDGHDPRTGKQVGPHTGSPASLQDYTSLWQAFTRQLRHAADLLAEVCNTTDDWHAATTGAAVRTLLVPSCLAAGRGVLAGGATYNAAQAECVGITNTADSLAAIRRLVFEEGRCTLPELVAVLRSDWAGQEPLAAYCRNRLPKFGNDDDDVDSIYRDVAELTYGEVRARPSRRGGHLMPGSVVFSYHTEYGARTGATPDGRRAGEPLADSAGPAQGRNRRGQTAVINSLTKFDQSLGTTCVVLNLMFNKRDFASGALADLVRSYFERGGMQLQINVVDKELLRQARERPEAFRHLTVRVGGYSAYYTELTAALQDDILARTAV